MFRERNCYKQNIMTLNFLFYFKLDKNKVKLIFGVNSGGK